MVCVVVVDYSDAVSDGDLVELPSNVVEMDVPVFVDNGTLSEVDGFYKGMLVVDTAGSGEFETLFLVIP